MARDETVTGRIESIAPGGAGFLRVGGKSVFVEMTAPGDMAVFRIAEERRDWARGELLEVREPGPGRAAPRCPHYGVCGGCGLQHLSYEAQREAKSALLAETFRRVGGVEIPPPPVAPSPPWEYRNRARFHLRASPPFLGFRERRSARVVEIRDCPVAAPGIRRLLAGGSGERPPVPPGKDEVTVYSRGDVLLWEGQGPGRVKVRDRELVMDAGLFFQSNAVMLEALIPDLADAARGADTGRPLADVYAGVGTFAAFLGEAFPGVDVVERNRGALALARENLRGTPGRFFPMTGGEWAKAGGADGCGFLVLDPPREGLSPALRRALASGGPRRLAYVSCSPATFARDCRELLSGGRRLTALKAYDFYPQTAHLECLALFER
ncbi:MAG: 23S rRNA (uracil-5-)-methyltransferase RumA [Treponematales bacterium]